MDGLTDWNIQDISNSNFNEKADVIVASYMLNEIKDDKKLQVLEKIWNNVNKILFIIEPGTPENYNNIMKYRDYLIKNGGCIVAPCPHQNKCELSENDWCHFTCRVERSKLHKYVKDAESPFEDEKFTYIIVSKENISIAKSRILRHPEISKGYLKLKLCTTDSGIKEKVISKKEKELYKIARKKVAGDEL